MTSIRSAKNKGSQLEIKTYRTLKSIYPDIQRLGGIGQIMEYDLLSEREGLAIECKRHKGFSWNELKKYFLKLEDRASQWKNHVLILQANQQPPLVMIRGKITRELYVTTFENYFGLPLTKGSKELNSKTFL